MKRILSLIFLSCFIACYSQNPYLKVIKDSSSLNNFGRVVFIEKDSLYIHLIYNSNYTIGGYCDGGNGSVYYAKLNKLNGQIISTKCITSSAHVMQAGAAFLYNNCIYLGGEMANPWLDKSAFLIKFSTITNSIVWQKNFNMNWYYAPQAPLNPCMITDISLTPDKNNLIFYGMGFCNPGYGASAINSFKGRVDTNNTGFTGFVYGAFEPLGNTRFTNANGGNKAYIISRQIGTGAAQLTLNNGNNALWAYDSGTPITSTTTGTHFVNKFGKRVIYLIDRANGSTCIITDSVNSILISKIFPGLHARSLTAIKNCAVLSFVNDVGGALGNEIIHVKIDSSLKILGAKKMFLNTFQYENFSCSSTMDTSFVYCLFSRMNSLCPEVFMHKFNFTTLSCNEQYFNPMVVTTVYSTSVAAISFSGAVNQTTYTPYTFSKGLKDSIVCFSDSVLIPSADFTPSVICAGINFTFTGVASNTPTSWFWYMPGANTSSSNVQNPVNTYSLSGTYNVSLTVTNAFGTKTTVKTITVIPTPIISVNSGSICPGDNFTITPSGGSSYTYSSGSPIVSPAITATYSVIGAGTEGCVSNSIVCTVNIHPLPTLTVTTNNNAVCEGESATLTAMGAQNYSWTLSQNTNTTGVTIIVTPTTQSIYTLNGSDINGCKNSIQFTLSVNLCIGMGDLPTQEKRIDIFPNPANSIITVKNYGMVKITALNVLDLFGRILIIGEVNTDSNFVLSELQPGIYFIHIKFADGKETVFKFVKAEN